MTDLDTLLAGVPLLLFDGPTGIRRNPERQQIIEQYAAEHGVALDVPKGARDLGCMNCCVGDRLRHPELPQRTYCGSCPVIARKDAR